MKLALIAAALMIGTNAYANHVGWQLTKSGEYIHVGRISYDDDRIDTCEKELSLRSLPKGALDLRPVREFPYEIDGPYEMHPKFPFLGEHFDATVYYLHTKGLKIPVVFPSSERQTPEAAFQVFHLLLSMPYKYIQGLKELRINPMPLDQTYDANGALLNVFAMASQEMMSLDFAPLWVEALFTQPKIALHVFGHEFGHILAYQFFGGPRPSAAYAQAAKLDNNEISEYGSTILDEDWAEAMGLYFLSAGGGPGRQLYPNRFAFIDRYFKAP